MLCVDGVCVQPACGSLAFDGDDSVDVANHNWDGDLTELTVEAWVNSSSPTQAWIARIVNRHLACGAGAAASSFSLHLEGAETLRLWVCKTEDPPLVSVGGDIGDVLKDGQWHHVAGTWKSGGMSRVFLDGNIVAELASTGGTVGKGELPLFLGGVPPYGQHYEGNLSSVRISSKVRYTEPFVPPQQMSPDADTLNLWLLSEGEGNTAHDSVAGKHGTLTGPTWVDGGPWPECCIPECAGKECGEDGCGGSCGACGEGFHCDADLCVPDCLPDCAGMECGDDGCGGSCGDCQLDELCFDGACKPKCSPYAFGTAGLGVNNGWSCTDVCNQFNGVSVNWDSKQEQIDYCQSLHPGSNVIVANPNNHSYPIYEPQGPTCKVNEDGKKTGWSGNGTPQYGDQILCKCEKGCDCIVECAEDELCVAGECAPVACPQGFEPELGGSDGRSWWKSTNCTGTEYMEPPPFPPPWRAEPTLLCKAKNGTNFQVKSVKTSPQCNGSSATATTVWLEVVDPL